MYSSYTAASFARKHELARKHGVNLEGALTWAFEFEDQPYFAGFRALATQRHRAPGAERLPHVLRRWAGEQRARRRARAEVPLDAMRRARACAGAPDVAALASREPGRAGVMAWHYHDDDVPGPDAAVSLAVEGLPPSVRAGDAHRVPDRRGPQQRLRRLEADGLADRPHAPAVRGARGRVAASLASREPSRAAASGGKLGPRAHAAAPGGLARRDRVARVDEIGSLLRSIPPSLNETRLPLRSTPRSLLLAAVLRSRATALGRRAPAAGRRHLRPQGRRPIRGSARTGAGSPTP